MNLEVNGVAYENFTAASAELRLDALSNTFAFEAVSVAGTPLPFKGGEACRVLIDDDPVVTGYIEVVDVNYDTRDHSISITGRDKTGDLLDSNISSLSDLRAPISLKGVIEQIIKHLEIDLTVIDNATPALFNAAEDLGAPEPGENAFEFIEGLARKRQVLLTSDSDGNIVITQATAVDSGAALQNIIGATDNNILSGTVSYDRTGRFNIYRFAATLNPIALLSAGQTDLAELVDQGDGITDADIRTGRQLVLIAEGPSSKDENNRRATWEANIRRARGRVYSVTVAGHRHAGFTGKLWTINTLVTVKDEFADIDAQMLINSVSFNFDQGGRTTTLTLVEKDAYTLALAEPEATQKVGVAFDLTA
jgi:prophage tail gpP-like protein